MQSIVPSLPSSILNALGSLETDNQYLTGLGLPTANVATNASSSLSKRSDGNVYMATVSPWFFTHYGPDTYNKNVGRFSAAPCFAYP
jgi:glucan endo-1,3-alpha-glucosidase